MSSIVDAGAVAPAAVGNAGLPQEPAEALVDVGERQRLPRRAGEEPVPAPEPRAAGAGERGSRSRSGALRGPCRSLPLLPSRIVRTPATRPTSPKRSSRA